MATYKNKISGFRWAGIADVIKLTALVFDLKIVEFIENKGWINTTIIFKVEGDAVNIQKFINSMNGSVEEYNRNIGW